jgi:DNA replication and repair protein RecF
MKNIPIKKIGSQGQQKTFLVSLKLAQFEFLNQVTGVKPILLLDDIFDKFDVARVSQILKLVSDDSFGQIFITHTSEERMRGLLKDYHETYSLFLVNESGVEKVNQ